MEDKIKEIEKLKKRKRAIILAHNYQRPEVQDIADFTGDSLELARKTVGLRDFDVILFCGVRFMAETAKILSPGKTVLLPESDAGCPLADMAEAYDVEEMRRKYPGAWVVSYVNTSAEVKALSDVCCTSANADRVVKNIPAKQVIFLPDRNLCSYVKNRAGEKDIICWEGYCYVHGKFTQEDVRKARKLYPEGEIIVHPECSPGVQKLADHIYSTSGMLKRARESEAKTFIIGTEEGLLHRMKKENPGKTFYSLGAGRTCYNMKKITLSSVKESLEKGIYEVEVEHETSVKARKALERMIEYA